MDEHEPIGWMVYTLDGTAVYVTDNPADFTENHRALPLYTDPPAREWVGLTEPELHQINPTWPAPGQHWDYEDVLAFARAIEAKLKEKNQ